MRVSQFYTDAGLSATVEGNLARLRCAGQAQDAIVLIAGAGRKRLHHISLRADGLDEIAGESPGGWGAACWSRSPPFERSGLWVKDPHGMLIHLTDAPARN